MIAFHKVKKSLVAPLVIWAPVLFIVLIAGMKPAPAGALELLIGTGEAGSFSHFTGRIIERVVSKHHPEITCKAVPSDDDLHNLTNLKQGSLDLALIDARMLRDAISKKGNFKFLDIQYDTLRGIMPIYDMPISLVVRSDAEIADLAQLKGRRINAGISRSSLRLATDTVMKAKGWEKDDFSLFAEISNSLSQDTMAFCHGTVQAMVHIGVHPDPSIGKLLQHCGAKLLEMNDDDMVVLARADAALIMTGIEADTYPDQKERLETIGSQTILVTTDALDEQTVYAVIDALFSNRQRFQDAHWALALNPVDPDAAGIASVELHPGAISYFSQN